MTRLVMVPAMMWMFAACAPDAAAQSGDPDRIDRQLALGHAAAIESAWHSVAARIGETDAGNFWEDEWSGLTAPPSGSWWLSTWTERGLTARYCDGVLAVYADRAELRGVGRDHRAVQVAPVAYGNQRSGLHLVTRGSRLYTGAHGRDGGALPDCMPIPSATGERAALVAGVDDPKLTPVGLRWETEDGAPVACAAPDTGTFVERRRIPIQVTAIDECPSATPNCNDLRELVTGLPAWPEDCEAREALLSATPPGLPPHAACSDWVRWRSDCRITYAAAPPAADIPAPVITWSPGGVHAWTSSCSCPPGQTGTCTEHWEQDTEIRSFVLRPGLSAVLRREPARENGDPILVSTVRNCAPIDNGNGGDGGGNGGGNGGNDGDGGNSGGNSGGRGGGGGGHVGGIGGFHGEEGFEPGQDNAGGGGDDGDGPGGGESGNGGSPP